MSFLYSFKYVKCKSDTESGGGGGGFSYYYAQVIATIIVIVMISGFSTRGWVKDERKEEKPVIFPMNE